MVSALKSTLSGLTCPQGHFRFTSAAVYLAWLHRIESFSLLCRIEKINNLRAFNRAFSPIPTAPTNISFSLTIVGGLTFISSAEERLDSSWQWLGAVVPCFADAASPAPNFAQPLD